MRGVQAVKETQSQNRALLIGAAYVVQGCLYAANYWSLGLRFSGGLILFITAIGAPFFGFCWLRVMGWMFQLTGRWLGGRANRVELSSRIGCAKKPLLLMIPIWVFFLYLNPRGVFILGMGDPSPVLINSIGILLGTLSQFLRIKAVMELQSFSFSRSLVNVVISWLFLAISFFFLFIALRFVYIYL